MYSSIFSSMIKNTVLSGPLYGNCVEATLINILIGSWRYKSGGRAKDIDKYQEEDSDSDSEDNVIVGKGTEIKTNVVGSMRADLLLKVGLGISRNKIETGFYESKIRINSKKIFKKSVSVQVGDEVDLIKGVSPSNPSFIIVGRIEVLSAKPRQGSDDIQIKLKRSKSLVIENYPDGDPWKQSDQQN